MNKKIVLILLIGFFFPVLGMNYRTPSPDPEDLIVNDPYALLEQKRRRYLADAENILQTVREVSRSYELLNSSFHSSCMKKPLSVLASLIDANDVQNFKINADTLCNRMNDMAIAAQGAHKQRDVSAWHRRVCNLRDNIKAIDTSVENVCLTMGLLNIFSRVPSLKDRQIGFGRASLPDMQNRVKTISLGDLLEDPLATILMANELKANGSVELQQYFLSCVKKIKKNYLDNHPQGNQLWIAQALELDLESITDANSIEGAIDPTLISKVNLYDEVISLLIKLTNAEHKVVPSARQVREREDDQTELPPATRRYEIDGWQAVSMSDSDSNDDEL